MYRPGKILTTESASANASTGTATVTPTSESIDLNLTPPVWKKVNPMAQPSVDHMLILLPDGNVFKVGGTTSMIVVPEGWLIMNAMRRKQFLLPRSGILRLVIGKVSPACKCRVCIILRACFFQTGGYLLAAAVNLPASLIIVTQIYSPPYLFNGVRPTITGQQVPLEIT